MDYTEAREQHRAVVAILVAVLIALAAMALAAFSSGPAEAAPKFKVVTRSFDRPATIFINDGSTGIPEEASPYPSTINVSGMRQGKILDVDVRLRGLIHPAPGNVDAVVFGPGRSGSARIMSDAGGNNQASGVTVTLDDEAPEFMPPSSPLRTTGYMPSNYEEILDPFPRISPNGNRTLTVFDGKAPNGPWKLFVVDDTSGFDFTEGQFAGGWAVTIKARVRR